MFSAPKLQWKTVGCLGRIGIDQGCSHIFSVEATCTVK